MMNICDFVVSAHGVPDDHIIVMMYDDIARNPRNPTPGIDDVR